MSTYEPHPVAEIFPLMTGREFDALVDDIREHGLREPIVLHDGKVLDGRNRLRACQQLGIEPAFEEWPNGESPQAYVVSKNLHRRHLNESQRAMIAAKIANMKSGTRTDLRPPPNLEEVSVPQAAAMLNTSPSSVYNAKAVLRAGSPEEIEAVQNGEAAVSTIDKKIRKRLANEAEPVREVEAAPPFHGARVQTPDGMTLEALGRKGMALERDGARPPEAAAGVGIGLSSYRKLRDILLLSDRDDLSGQNQKIVAAVLADMNATSSVLRPYEAVKPIISLIYGNGMGGRREQIESFRLANFERAFGIITQVCTDTCEIEIPYFGAERATQIIAEIKDAERHLAQFRRKIEETFG